MGQDKSPTSGGTLCVQSSQPCNLSYLHSFVSAGWELLANFGRHASTIPISNKHVMPVKFVNVDEEVKRRWRGFLLFLIFFWEPE